MEGRKEGRKEGSGMNGYKSRIYVLTKTKNRRSRNNIKRRKIT